jgi:hypothetical protein
MRKVSWLSAVAAIAVFFISGTRTANANIVSWNCANDGDGAINCVATDWANPSPGNYEMTITGDQFWAPGDMWGTFTTDSSGDPALFITNSIDNDTAGAWTAYEADVAMSSTFLLSLDSVTSPPGWSVTSLNQPTLDLNPLDPNYGLYVGSIFMSGTPTIQVGGELDFQYLMDFTGTPNGSFTFHETLTPTLVPEPGAVGLLALCGIGLMTRRHRKN